MLILGGRLVRHLFYIMSRNELFEYPKDDLINFLSQTFDRIPAGAMKFAAVYILIHGVLNIFLVVQLYRERLWAYLVTIGAMIIFIIYQIYRISIYHSRVLTVITVIDVVFIFLAWNEYKLHKEAKMS